MRVQDIMKIIVILLWVAGLLVPAGCDYETEEVEEEKYSTTEPEREPNLADVMRHGHATLVYDGKMWILGGRNSYLMSNPSVYSFLNDVWYSTDGVHWICAATGADWGRRTAHAGVVFNGKMWIIGGTYFNRYNQQVYCRDAWCSENGRDWEYAGQCPWRYRADMAVVVHNGRLYVIGGQYGAANYFADVWSTADGVNWRQDCGSLPVPEGSGLAGAAAVSCNGKIWLIGGESYGGNEGSYYYPRHVYYLHNTVMTSVDGSSWQAVQYPFSPFPGRAAHRALAIDGTIWLSGGSGEAAGDNVHGYKGYFFDLYMLDTTAGSNSAWVRVDTMGDNDFPGRCYHSFVHYDGKFRMFLGYGMKSWIEGPDEYGEFYRYYEKDIFTDAWSSADGVEWEMVHGE